MKVQEKIKALSDRRKKRVRYAVCSVNRTKRPRIYIYLSNKYITAQLIDEKEGKTLLSASTQEASFKGKSTKNKVAAEALAELFAKKMQDKDVSDEQGFIFDRGSKLYHGRIKAFADKLREKGLKF